MSSEIDSTSSQNVRLRTWVLAMLPLALIVAARAGVIGEGDPFWETRAGLDIFDGQPIIHYDTWSWVHTTDKWIPNSWLWNVLMGAAWKMGGFAAIGITMMIAGAGLFVVLVRQCRRYGADVWAAGLACAIGSLGVAAWITGRPNTATFIAYVVELAIAARLFDERRSSRVAAWSIAIVAVQALTINLHLGAESLIGPLVFAGVGSLVQRRKDLSLALCVKSALPAVACTLGTVLNPIGLDVFQHALFVRSQSASVITEWQPGVNDPRGVVLIIAGIWAIVLAWRAGRGHVAGALVCAIVAAVSAVRFEPFVALLVIPEYAVWFSQLVRKHAIAHERVGLLIVEAVFCLALLPLAIEGLVAPGQPASPRFSVKMVRAIPGDCKLFNGPLDGGLVELLRPGMKVAMDGRNDFFGKERVLEQRDVLRAKVDSLAWFDDHDIDCVLARTGKKERGLVAVMDRDPRWRVLGADGQVKLYQRVSSK